LAILFYEIYSQILPYTNDNSLLTITERIEPESITKTQTEMEELGYELFDGYFKLTYYNHSNDIVIIVIMI
jgi:hypothetical protein